MPIYAPLDCIIQDMGRRHKNVHSRKI